MASHTSHSTAWTRIKSKAASKSGSRPAHHHWHSEARTSVAPYYVTRRDFAERSGVPEPDLERYLEAAQIPSLVTPSGAILIPYDSAMLALKALETPHRLTSAA